MNDLLLWRDPKKSGIFFGVATLVFVTFMFMKMPLIALICYSAGALILLTTLWSRFGKTIGKCELSSGVGCVWSPQMVYPSFRHRISRSRSSAFYSHLGVRSVRLVSVERSRGDDFHVLTTGLARQLRDCASHPEGGARMIVSR